MGREAGVGDSLLMYILEGRSRGFAAGVYPGPEKLHTYRTSEMETVGNGHFFLMSKGFFYTI